MNKKAHYDKELREAMRYMKSGNKMPEPSLEAQAGDSRTGAGMDVDVVVSSVVAGRSESKAGSHAKGPIPAASEDQLQGPVVGVRDQLQGPVVDDAAGHLKGQHHSTPTVVSGPHL